MKTGQEKPRKKNFLNLFFLFSNLKYSTLFVFFINVRPVQRVNKKDICAVHL